jgi:TonB family protein
VSTVAGNGVPGIRRACRSPHLCDEETLGSLDEEAAQEGVNARLGQVTTCYMRERSSVTNLAGRVDLKFRVTTSGKVRWVRVVRSDLGSLPVEQCILRELAKAKFAAPEGGEAEFSIPIGLDPREVVLASGAVTTPTRVPPEAKKLIASCKKLRPSGALPPGLLVTVYVDPEGTILSAGVSSASGEVPSDVATELVTRLKALKLPSRDDGHIIKVVTPFACRR